MPKLAITTVRQELAQKREKLKHLNHEVSALEKALDALLEVGEEKAASNGGARRRIYEGSAQWNRLSSAVYDRLDLTEPVLIKELASTLDQHRNTIQRILYKDLIPKGLAKEVTGQKKHRKFVRTEVRLRAGEDA